MVVLKYAKVFYLHFIRVCHLWKKNKWHRFVYVTTKDSTAMSAFVKFWKKKAIPVCRIILKLFLAI